MHILLVWWTHTKKARGRPCKPHASYKPILLQIFSKFDERLITIYYIIFCATHTSNLRLELLSQRPSRFAAWCCGCVVQYMFPILLGKRRKIFEVSGYSFSYIYVYHFFVFVY